MAKMSKTLEIIRILKKWLQKYGEMHYGLIWWEYPVMKGEDALISEEQYRTKLEFFC